MTPMMKRLCQAAKYALPYYDPEGQMGATDADIERGVVTAILTEMKSLDEETIEAMTDAASFPAQAMSAAIDHMLGSSPDPADQPTRPTTDAGRA